YGLEVLSDLDPVSIGQAKKMVEEDSVKIGLAETDLKLYVKASVLSEGHKASAVIAGDHDNIVETSFDGQVLTSSQKKADGEVKESKSTLDYKLTVKEIYEFASTVAYEDIEFILESRTLNLALAQEGLKGTYGLKVGYAIALNENKEVFGGDFLCYAMSLTAAASDARMAGCTLAAMSNSGSGNQGITVTMPVIAYSLRYGTCDEQLARALVLSHLIAIHIKGYLGKLSALCGCVIASTGSACGLVYLRGGDYEQICAAIKNMIGNITGMVCDGAKVGCAMKVASGVSSALQSAVLAREGICISEHDGIIEKDIEKTVRNLGRIGSVGMQNTDNMILDIMVCK
ncbi:MAG: serine dehydratase subunit alpha family protein, partial [Bacteroidales bacterium]|nr:serine dehydratase subunit alpha family protein [Bacteroidales bacterium]